MLKIENIDKIIGMEYGRYKIHSVKDFSESYSFAVLDTDDMRYFRIDLMKYKIKGDWQLRWAPSKYFNISTASIWDTHVLLQDMAELIIKHRKPIKGKTLTIKNFKNIENVKYSSKWDFHHVEETDGYYTFTLRTSFQISNKIFYQQIEVNRFPDSMDKHNVLYDGKIYKFRKNYFNTIAGLILALRRNIK